MTASCFVFLLQVHRIGDFFTTVLLTSKHRGAFELAYTGFVKLCSTLWMLVEYHLLNYNTSGLSLILYSSSPISKTLSVGGLKSEIDIIAQRWFLNSFPSQIFDRERFWRSILILFKCLKAFLVCFSLVSCEDASLRQLPHEWLSSLMSDITANVPSEIFCGTRRSAGVPFFIQVKSNMSRPQKLICKKTYHPC